MFVLDDQQFRNFVIWIEEKKIRHYKIEEREGLRSNDQSLFDCSLKQVLTSWPLMMKSLHLNSLQACIAVSDGAGLPSQTHSSAGSCGLVADIGCEVYIQG